MSDGMASVFIIRAQSKRSNGLAVGRYNATEFAASMTFTPEYRLKSRALNETMAAIPWRCIAATSRDVMSIFAENAMPRDKFMPSRKDAPIVVDQPELVANP